MKRIRLGTRGSTLAMTQSGAIAARLRLQRPDLTVDLVEISTSGDRIGDVPLVPALGQAFFTREIEEALRAGRIDLAVHSCKDLATVLPEGLVLGAIPEREDPRDALVGPSGGLGALPSGARVGTSSPRRQRFLAAHRSDLDFVDLRGNVPTRVAAVDEGRCDAVILAVAGLRRLGLEHRITEVLALDVLLPAAGQGALAVQVREDDDAMLALVSTLDHAASRAEITAERACLRRLEGGCQSPVGALGRVRNGEVELRATVASPGEVVAVRVAAPPDDAEALGVRAAEAILAKLRLTSLKDAPWAGPPPARLESR